jgi:hypothetical protein
MSRAREPKNTLTSRFAGHSMKVESILWRVLSLAQTLQIACGAAAPQAIDPRSLLGHLELGTRLDSRR